MNKMVFILLALMILPDIYIYLVYVRKFTKRSLLRWIYWMPTLVLIGILAYIICTHQFSRTGMNWIGSYFFWVLFFSVPKALFAIFSVVGNFFLRWLPFLSKLFNVVGIVVALVALFILSYGHFEGYKRMQINEVTYSSSKLPQAFDGFRIVQFSDLHLGNSKGNVKVVEKLIEQINAQQGDIIVFTGDLVNYNADEVDDFKAILSQLKAPDGVYSVLGNHDYGSYYHWENAEAEAHNLEKLKRYQSEMGWRLLLNENVLLPREDTCIALIGVENDGLPPFPEYGDLPKAQQGTDGLFKVLLSHDPTHWRRKVLPQTDIQLMLAGHTHAMQLQFGSFSPAQYVYDEALGMYLDGERGLYVNVGSGSVVFPFRFGAWSEITVITLRKK